MSNIQEIIRFEDGKIPIFLHFMNREAPRNLNIILSEGFLEKIIRTILSTSTELLLCDISYIWENYSSFSRLNKIILRLIELGEIDLISSYQTTDMFLFECQELYKFDSNRYSVFYEDIPPKLILQQPSFIKDESTSKHILSNLLSLKYGLKCPDLEIIDKHDKSVLIGMRDKIDSLIQKASNKAITLSLFNEEFAQENIKLAFARFSTFSHFNHYLSFSNSDIISGIKNFYYYDTLSKHMLIYNYKFLSLILEGLQLQKCVLSENPNTFPDKISIIRKSTDHKDFVFNIRCLLNGIRFIISNNNSTANNNIYTAICEQIKSILYLNNKQASRFNNKSLHDTFLIANSSLKNIIISLRKDLLFGEFLDSWEHKMQNKKKVLFVVSTNSEARFLKEIAETKFNLRLARIHSTYHTIYSFGEIAKTDIYMVQSEMGKETPGGIILTAIDSIDFLKPDAVICVGIAYGLNQKKQKLGDVLIAKQMCGYDLKKVIEKKGKQITISRGDKIETSTKLLDRFRSGSLDWEGCKLHFGLILSGSTLTNSSTFTKQLLTIEPEAIGGEMEGAGLYNVVAKRKVDWILVKGICDWGKRKTDAYQEVAAKNATLYAFHVISQGGLSV